MTSPSALEEPGPGRPVRLIFEFDGDDVRLVSQQRVDVAVTGFDLAIGPPGHYVETRDDAGDTLARVPARDAFAGSVEVFPEQPGEPITRVDVERRRGAFTVVVPAPEPAQAGRGDPGGAHAASGASDRRRGDQPAAGRARGG